MNKARVICLSLILVVSILMNSCATILGGQITSCQKTKPPAGEPQRAVRVPALIADIILFWPGAIVDFATGAIYKPCINRKNYNEL